VAIQSSGALPFIPSITAAFGVEARMVERVAAIRTDHFAMGGPRVELEDCRGPAWAANTANIARWSSGLR
jgi:hypothetical protein